MRRRIYMQSSSKKNTTKKSWIGFSPIGFGVTQAIFNSISRMQIASHSSTSQESTRQDTDGVSIAISNEQQAALKTAPDTDSDRVEWESEILAKE